MELALASALFLFMFVYSGVNKFAQFPSKVMRLQKKLPAAPLPLIRGGMYAVAVLEIVAPLVVVLYWLLPASMRSGLFRTAVQICVVLLALFVMVVTPLYHPPRPKKMIPFLSNVSTLGGLCLLFLLMVRDRQR